MAFWIARHDTSDIVQLSDGSRLRIWSADVPPHCRCRSMMSPAKSSKQLPQPFQRHPLQIEIPVLDTMQTSHSPSHGCRDVPACACKLFSPMQQPADKQCITRPALATARDNGGSDGRHSCLGDAT